MQLSFRSYQEIAYLDLGNYELTLNFIEKL
jgi:hypothetical protein